MCATSIKWARRERELDRGCLMSPFPKANCPPPLHTLLPHDHHQGKYGHNTPSRTSDHPVPCPHGSHSVGYTVPTGPGQHTLLTYWAVRCRDGLERRGRWGRGSGRDRDGTRSHGSDGSSRCRDRSRGSMRKCRGGYRGRGSRRGSHCIRGAGGGGGTRRGGCSVTALLALVSQAFHVLRQLSKPVRLHLLFKATTHKQCNDHTYFPPCIVLRDTLCSADAHDSETHIRHARSMHTQHQCAFSICGATRNVGSQAPCLLLVLQFATHLACGLVSPALGGGGSLLLLLQPLRLGSLLCSQRSQRCLVRGRLLLQCYALRQQHNAGKRTTQWHDATGTISQDGN